MLKTDKIRLIVDTSNLDIGGGIQVAVSFVKDLISANIGGQFYLIESCGFRKALGGIVLPDNFTRYQLSERTSKNIAKRVAEVQKYEKVIEADAIFTVFGPSYHKSALPKLVGFAIPHIIYSQSPYFSMITLKEKFRFWALSKVKTLAFTRNSDALVFETAHARDVFIERFHFKKHTFVQPNTLNTVFQNRASWRTIPQLTPKKHRILLMASPNKHKNFGILPYVISILIKNYGWKDFSFLITLTRAEAQLPAEFDPFIDYVGKVTIEEVPDLYQQSDLVFVPSLLEVFSATYLEAMFMKKPLVVADLGFAQDICADAALYCTADSAEDYAAAIAKVLENREIAKNLVEAGERNLKRFGGSMERTLNYMKMIKEIVHENKK